MEKLRSRGAKTILFAVITMLLGVGALSGCGDDDSPATPQAFVSPVDGKTYCAWVENPSECPTTSGAPAPAPFGMPQDRPTQDNGISNTDFLLMMALFNYHTAYAPWYGSPFYYNSFVSPAWHSHPGVFYSGPNRTTVHVTNVNNYSQQSKSFDTRYAKDETASQKNATYKTKTGKTYSGKTVPKSTFSGTNVSVKNGVVTPKSGSGFKIGGSGGSKPFSGSSGRSSGGSRGFSGGRR